MYQVNFSLNKENMSWFIAVEEALKLRIKEFYGIMAYKLDYSRLNISVACEQEFKQQLLCTLKDTLIDMYSRVCKMEYLKKHLRLPAVKKGPYRILLHTLVAFDRECEREIISASFGVTDGMALDGIYNFKLKEMKQRWDDICKLTLDNSLYLSDEYTFNELLRFLISAINPKINKLTIYDSFEDYRLLGQLNEEQIEFNIRREELIYYLVDLAPMELVLMGDFKDKSLYNQIILLFDAKHCHDQVRVEK